VLAIPDKWLADFFTMAASAKMPIMQKELSTAIAAVVRASRLTQKIFTSIQSGHTNLAATVTKIDKSPVTIADYGSQAIVNAILHSAFPKDPIVGEEDADELRKNPDLRAKVWKLVSSTLQETPPKVLEEEGGLIESDDEMITFIDRGNSIGGKTGRTNTSYLSILIAQGFWTLDPIDGTLGFLRGGQYAVCLALIVDGDVKVGVLGCPNLSIKFNDPESARGVVIYGVSGGQAYQTTLDDQGMENTMVCRMQNVDDLANAKFCESVESGHSSHEEQAQIAKLLGIGTASVRMDSQAKYACLARGDAEIYLRLPVNMKYEEKIWVNETCIHG